MSSVHGRDRRLTALSYSLWSKGDPVQCSASSLFLFACFSLAFWPSPCLPLPPFMCKCFLYVSICPFAFGTGQTQVWTGFIPQRVFPIPFSKGKLPHASGSSAWGLSKEERTGFDRCSFKSQWILLKAHNVILEFPLVCYNFWRTISRQALFLHGSSSPLHCSAADTHPQGKMNVWCSLEAVHLHQQEDYWLCQHLPPLSKDWKDLYWMFSLMVYIMFLDRDFGFCTLIWYWSLALSYSCTFSAICLALFSKCLNSCI